MSATAPARYTKRPVTVEAVQFDGTPESAASIMKWVDSTGGTARYNGEALIILTLEGPMKAASGWWVIRGLVGEFYPCDPDVFAQSYDPEEETKGVRDMWEYKTEYTPHPGFPGTGGWHSTSGEAHAWVAEQSDPEEWRVVKRRVSPWTVDSKPAEPGVFARSYDPEEETK